MIYSIDISQNLIQRFVEYIYKNESNLTYPNDESNFFYIKQHNNKDASIGIGYGTYTFNYKNNLIKIVISHEGEPRSTDSGYLEYFERVVVSYDNKEILTQFCDDIFTIDKKSEKDNLFVYTCNKEGYWDLYSKIPSRHLDSVYLDDKIKKKVVDDITNFCEQENEYNKFGIPYKRVYLLTGIPGSGKTSFIKALCKHFNYNLYMLSICKGFDNNSLMTAIKDVKDNSIILIEDIDSLFEKRASTSDNTSITFSSIINILDGVLYKTGNIIFMTTNHPEKLDHALLRIGRIDMIIQINLPSKIHIEKLFIDIMKNRISETDVKSNFEEFYDYIKNKKITMSSIVNFLFRYRESWKENINEIIDTDNFIKDTLKQRSDTGFYT